MTKEQAREALSQKSDAELLKAYAATRPIEQNIINARAEHVVAMFYLEFELCERGLPTRSQIKVGWGEQHASIMA